MTAEAAPAGPVTSEQFLEMLGQQREAMKRAAANIERIDETYDQPASSADTNGPTRQRWRTVGGKVFPVSTIHW